MSIEEVGMEANGYRNYLEARSMSTATIDKAIAVISKFEIALQAFSKAKTVDTASRIDAQAFSEQLISEGENSFDNYLALLRYGSFSRNRTLYVAVLEFLDGSEAFGNLHIKMAEVLGEAKRDAFFEGVTLPPLGTPNEKKPALVQRVLSRLETQESEACKHILGSGLRDLRDEWFQDAVTAYEACSGLDEYLAEKSKRFIAELERHKQEGKWWFVQEVTDDVIEHVRQRPMMSGGVRDGNVIYEVKIPYMAKEWLAETDPKMRRYHACHCPWVRESLRTGEVTVSPIFCNCSAAFHKKPWEIIFGQSLHAEVLESILKGDEQCKLAIHLPEGVI
jgi:hypothetical protein